MGKIRNYTYGSPKFEGEMNKAISEASGGGKVYQHNIYIVAADSDSNSYLAIFCIYNTNADMLLNPYATTIDDVKTLIKNYCFGYATPYHLEDYIFYSIYVKNDDSLWGSSVNIANQTHTKKTIATISTAFDTVVEM